MRKKGKQIGGIRVSNWYKIAPDPMPAPASLVQADGRLSPSAREVLHAMTGVPVPLLDGARIRHARDNWIRAPWYRYHRGGAITMGRTIWFTRKWFEAGGYGDGSPLATWNWLLHLAHEAGHLPQAERFGLHLFGKARYVLAFAAQYGTRALLLRRAVHDGAPLEIEADRGRWVLSQLMGREPLAHRLVHALHAGDADTVHEQCHQLAPRIADLSRRYTVLVQQRAPRY